MYVRLRIDISISISLLLSTIHCSASAGAELLPATYLRLLQLPAADQAASVLFTPDRIVQTSQFRITGEAMIMTVVLYSLRLNTELLCNRAIALTLEAHSADHVFLYVIQCNHILLSA